ncbi:hypothetical protein LQ318_01105 [Aliifodinibius salicampi]|uniref:4-O-methyl-glucuronoyl methylesterase-like domain-containing protein n=1 Tax=Fodinibius salicampi TaxID=1920655 RepID=A0ABT3PUH4_9BACT|nr:hypothetical protein [Fodinibius salicampi]MCW9711487.1 hypothetical protein [Fodinibius salicampi]
MDHIPVKAGLLFLIVGFTACLDSSENGGDESLYDTEIPFAVENTGTDCIIPSIINYTDLEKIPHMPDPFLDMEGNRITDIEDWRCRRAEISAQVQKFELGLKPETAQEKVSTTMDTDTTMTVTVEENDTTISFEVDVNYPSHGKAPYPAMIGIGRSFLNNSDLDSLGVAVIQFPNNELGEQMGSNSRGKGKFYDIFGNEHTASAMMAWAWGVSRLIDGLQTTEGIEINPERIGITGCSRNGKGALMAGALDERIVLTIPQESGSGGAAGWRISDAQYERGQEVQTLRQIVQENVWFTEDFEKFSESVERLPYDHHSVMGMIAPRALLILENSDIEWLGNESTYTTSVIAREIWKAMGISDRMGISQVGGHNHCQLPDTQRPEVNAFVKKFLLDDSTVNTRVVRMDTDLNVDLTKWAPWETPTL